MELPADVLIHNQTLGWKGTGGTLLAVSDDGYYELKCKFGEAHHRVMMPIIGTVLISRGPEEAGVAGELDIER